MATSRYEDPGMPPGTQQPAWEIPRGYHPKPSIPSNGEINSDKHHTRASRITAAELFDRLDRVVPPHRQYLGLRRRFFLLAMAATITLAVLAIGLGVGLTRRSGNEALPLPSNARTFTGDLTYYSPALGACGITSSDSDNIVSISHIVFDAASTSANPNANPLCGLMIRATRFNEQANGNRSVDLKVVDRCVGCEATDIDLSPGAFDKLADPARGRVPVTWAWLSSTPPTAT